MSKSQFPNTEGMCESPHDNPARWAMMLSAYVDETGQESKGLVFVSGFLGDIDAWKKCAAEWPGGFKGSQRKSLHLARFKFKFQTEKTLLERLGPIPEGCGLKRVSGSVNVSDYADLVEGSVSEVHP